ncbi:SRPBCC domain-containing protein [Streptomyces sp. enrichment culture]|uniref:SRPBCC domain-containing protein n=1 Tax=Streptomyces sp. enrichment culture TaxID=1795815 RepID=UPI003F5495F2
MEHEVHVPVSSQRVRAALADPATVARAVPGLQQEEGADPIAGRLKVRIGNTTITYRGTAVLTPREDGTCTVEGDGAEARGTGSVKFALTLRLRDTEEGCTLAFEGTATADGRVTDFPPDTVTAAITRLLNRFAENLATEEPAEGKPAGQEPAEEKLAEQEPAEGKPAEQEPVEEKPAEEAPASVFETEVPPPALDPLADDVDETPSEPLSEAAHARRTMIGRSAEEVDHAPPRGRYAPVPAPQTTSPATTLRWAAPAAALVVASVIVAGRALRRRR